MLYFLNVIGPNIPKTGRKSFPAKALRDVHLKQHPVRAEKRHGGPFRPDELRARRWCVAAVATAKAGISLTDVLARLYLRVDEPWETR